MATKLNLDPSLKFTDSPLRSFHQQRAGACIALQYDLDEGFLSLTEAVTKIGSFTDKVRTLVKKYQHEKQTTTSGSLLQNLYADSQKEYRVYKATELKAGILFENIEKTIAFVQPTRRSRSDEKALQENLPDYYAEMKQFEIIFAECITKIKGNKSLLSPLKHTLSAAINSKILTTALDTLRFIAENQRPYPSKSTRFLNHIIPSIIVEKASAPPLPPPKPPLYTPSWKTLPLEMMNNPAVEELLTSSSRRHSVDSGECLRLSSPKRQPTSFESLSYSSPRKGMLSSSREIARHSPPQKRIVGASSHSPRRTVPAHLSGSGGNAPYRPSGPSRERFAHLSSSSSPRYAPAYESPRTLQVPHLTRKKFERDVSPEPKSHRRLHMAPSPLLNRKSYENPDASVPYSRSRY